MEGKIENESGSDSRIVRTLEALKRHPLMVILGAVVAALGGCMLVLDAGERVTPVVSNVLDPYRVQEEAISSLTLERTIDFVNGELGLPQEAVDLCQRVPICTADRQAEPVLNIYRDEHYTVRAVFEENSLEFFAVTLESGKFMPHIRWLDYNLGELGKVTYRQAYDPVDAEIEPTPLIFVGPQSSSYVEVFAPGAPGNYQGLMLGWAPDGYGDLPWEADAALALDSAQISAGGGSADLQTAETFRVASVPNTFGLFHDDGGHIGNLLHDPQNVIALLYAGTNL